METTDYSRIKLSKRQMTELQPVMHSWRTVYAFIADMDDSNENLTKLAEMLVYEMSNPDGPREQLLTRLHMRINAMRQRLESRAVLQKATR